MNATQVANQVTPVTLGGAIAAIIVWLFGILFPGIEVPNEIAVAVGTLCIFAVQRGWSVADPIQHIKKNPLEPNK